MDRSQAAARSEAARPSAALTSPAAAPERIVPPQRDGFERTGPARLVLSRGPNAGTGFAVTAPRTTIGRDRASDVVVDDATVSRYHAELHHEGGRYVLRDGGSLNGTYVNRIPVQEAAVLSDGDEIWIGKARFTFRTGT
ncbi:hypothetical protein GCM10025787_54950 [Saccharopolyspora rosea]|uniref:FHA domain-containing protein n=1 Tax=Saccharopolyspora rosea TaxID=524884 RepID=A0ABW3FW49_9PSEU